MKNIITMVVRPIADFLIWQYKQIDGLRPDDTPNEVLFLNAVALACEAGAVYAAFLLFGKAFLAGG